MTPVEEIVTDEEGGVSRGRIPFLRRRGGNKWDILTSRRANRPATISSTAVPLFLTTSLNPLNSLESLGSFSSFSARI